MPSLSARIIALIVTGALILLILGAGLHFWQKSRSQAAQSRVEQGQAGAAANSAADAVNTVAASGANESASETLTRSNEQEIRNAPGANAPVNPAARDAGLRSLCRRAAYRDDPKCKLLNAPAH